MMKNIVAAILISLLPFTAFAAEKKESAYDRVITSGKIRCGYGTWKPWIYQDLETGKLKGLTVDLMEEVGRQLDLKLEWPEETGWGELPTSLANGRVDVACSTLWNDPARGKILAMTQPVFYTAIYAYMREGDARFTGKLEEINNPDVRIAVQEGDFTYALAVRQFPRAQLVSIPPNVAATDAFLNVTTGKADVTFIDGVAMSDFNKNNAVKLARIPLARPVAVYGNTLAVGIKETELRDMLETTIRYMLQTGTIESVTADFRKEYPDAIILPAKPY